jgi:hypothetical protein
MRPDAISDKSNVAREVRANPYVVLYSGSLARCTETPRCGFGTLGATPRRLAMNTQCLMQSACLQSPGGFPPPRRFRLSRLAATGGIEDGGGLPMPPGRWQRSLNHQLMEAVKQKR